MNKRILIEPLLFDDFYVAIYDEENNLLLDKKYYCAGINSAKLTALDLKFREGNQEMKIYVFHKGEVLLEKYD